MAASFASFPSISPNLSTAQIQTVLSANAGGIVYARPGTYAITGNLELSTGTTLFGAGMGATIFRLGTDSASLPIFFTDGADDVTVSNLTIDGNNLNQSSFETNPYDAGDDPDDNQVGVAFMGGTRCRVINCRLHNMGHAGVYFWGSTYGLAQGIEGYDNGFGTVVAWRNGAVECSFLRVLGCAAKTDYCDSFRIITDDALIADCTGESLRKAAAAPFQFAALFFAMGSRLSATNVHSVSASGNGIDLDPDCTDWTLSGCTSHLSGNAGIICPSYGSITNCVVTDSGNDSDQGAFSSAGICLFGTRITCTGNTSRDTRTAGARTQTYGIDAYPNTGTFPPSYSIVTGNVLTNNVTGAISTAVSGGTGMTVANNITA